MSVARKKMKNRWTLCFLFDAKRFLFDLKEKLEGQKIVGFCCNFVSLLQFSHSLPVNADDYVEPSPPGGGSGP